MGAFDPLDLLRTVVLFYLQGLFQGALSPPWNYFAIWLVLYEAHNLSLIKRNNINIIASI